MALLGDVFLDVVFDDAPQFGVKASEHPIEMRESIVDHVNKNAVKMSISGVVTGDDTEQRRKKIVEYMEKGELLKYTNRLIFSNMIVTDFQPTKDATILNGFKFTMTLMQVRLSKTATITPLSVPVQKQTKAVTKKGRQQTKEKKSTSQVKKTSSKKKTTKKKEETVVSNTPTLLSKLGAKK